MRRVERHDLAAQQREADAVNVVMLLVRRQRGSVVTPRAQVGALGVDTWIVRLIRLLSPFALPC